MATQKQIEELTALFAEARPEQKNAWQTKPSVDNEGMTGVLIYLYRMDKTVTAGMISQVMHVTTGRVSVLLKKMEDKGLVVRTAGKKDARVTEVSLTEKGKNIVEEMQKERNEQMKKLIDTIGMDRLKEYIETSKEVWKILTPLKTEL